MSKPEFTVADEDVERLVELFERMPCVLSEPELTPEQQAAFDKEVAWEEADRKRVEAIFSARIIELQQAALASSAPEGSRAVPRV